MPEEIQEKVQKKLKEGWIKSWMMIEALAVTEEAVKSALEKHVKKLGLEKNVIIARKDFKKTQKVDKPFPNIRCRILLGRGAGGPDKGL